jgi:hypothetical protein
MKLCASIAAVEQSVDFDTRRQAGAGPVLIFCIPK